MRVEEHPIRVNDKSSTIFFITLSKYWLGYWEWALFVQNQKRDLGVVAYFFHSGSEQNTLKEIQVFGHHGDHVNIPTFGKALHGGFQVGAGEGMETMIN